MFIEVCVDNIHSARVAIECGVNRLELCSSLAVGGLTPSVALVHHIRQICPSTIPLHCLIRPRTGDFCYSQDELEIMYKEIDDLKNAGATGFVIGCLTLERSIDYVVTRHLIGHIRKTTPRHPITFHRAFDIARFDDLSATLAKLAELGCDWLLTSGRAKSVALGKSTLIEIDKTLKTTNSALQLLCGGGVNEAFIADCLADTTHRLSHFHGSFSKRDYCENDIFDLAPCFSTQRSMLTAILLLE